MRPFFLSLEAPFPNTRTVAYKGIGSVTVAMEKYRNCLGFTLLTSKTSVTTTSQMMCEITAFDRVVLILGELVCGTEYSVLTVLH